MLAPHLLPSALAHVNTPVLKQALSGPAWTKKPSEGDGRGSTVLSSSNINPHGSCRLDMDKRPDLAPVLPLPCPLPCPRTSAATVGPVMAESR
ncbi:hypothetical protein ACGFY9_22470 [Streptomyces sp. NPDC048504]|uniref:hypothetical protein n=1 Tax=Streptomyces sp. NPDC048504 TaxID=3365559 RepID=UPI0037133CDA